MHGPRENQMIAPIDFAKQDDIAATLASSHFDLIIVDEAHKMSAYRYGEKWDKTGRYDSSCIMSISIDNWRQYDRRSHCRGA